MKKDSFALVNVRAEELNLNIDNRYRVTDKLVQEITQFVKMKIRYVAIGRRNALSGRFSNRERGLLVLTPFEIR